MGVNEVALGLTLGIAVFTDWREHKIYNKLLVPAFFTALLLHTFQGGISGLTSSLLGAGMGFVLLLLPYLMGGMGAGDVKLLAVIGAFGGAPFVLTSFLYGAVIGGIVRIPLRQRGENPLRRVEIAPFLVRLAKLPGKQAEAGILTHQFRGLLLGGRGIVFEQHFQENGLR